MVELFAVSFVIVPLVLNVAMLISVSKEPDERAAHIRARATHVTFIFMNGYIVSHVIRMFVEAFTQDPITPYDGLNPIFLLGITSFTYFLSLLYFKKKFGG